MVRAIVGLKVHQPILHRRHHPRARDFTSVRIVTVNSPIAASVASAEEPFLEQLEADIYRAFHWLYDGDVCLHIVWL